ncbi:DegT/DnrJ/EryC1/StrS aminotransferase family protein [Aminithiophilus ramosus]|uniref:DegT/DnrJ/EryC1/StrS aminotransferase family protein n=1 Tax=Aminithiophilus ramosus TaxID=3029084 RepID=A0A9Q7AQQ2_9BACT|nr:hypothetical protein [Aminithiophilus ramosus]QTX32286.1 DegT/DnrJ/EryC1/StrS aminotransferase family protein [Aminithiophilus ramosus]
MGKGPSETGIPSSALSDRISPPFRLIGGDPSFTGTPLKKGAVFRHPFDGEGGQRLWVDSGRSALAVALAALRERGARRAWLPFLCCSSVVEPFLEASFSLRFYGQSGRTPFWTAPPSELRPTKDDVLLFIHYFGFLNEGMAAFLDGLDEARRPFVVEDAVPASLTEGTGRWGDVTLRSFRKFLPVADGAVVASRDAFLAGTVCLGAPDIRRLRLKGWAALGRYLCPDEGRRWLALARQGEERFDGRPRLPSPLSLKILARCDLPSVVAARRRNYERLLEELERHRILDPLHPIAERLPPHVVPQGLPLRLFGGSRDEVLRRLRREGIFCPVDWGVNSLAEAPAEEDAGVARSLLVLPVDQGLNGQALSFIADRVGDALRTGGQPPSLSRRRGDRPATR